MLIEILGPKDYKTENIKQNIKQVLNTLQIRAQLKCVTDPTHISKYGFIRLPALIINGDVKFKGMIPSTDQIKRAIQSS